MTWVIGTAPPFGHAILVSDVRVNFRNGTYLDCLQKIYPVGRFIMAGFSGSVRIGFAQLEMLRRESARMQDGVAWDVDIIANTWWPRCARRVFAIFPSDERALGCQLIFASAHPTRNRGSAPWPWTDVHRFSAPDFSIQKATDSRDILAIGKGAGQEQFMQRLTELVDGDYFLKLIEVGAWAQASALVDSAESEIRRLPLGGISSQFQFGTVTRAAPTEWWEITVRESTTFNSDGTETVRKLPPLAGGYRQFLDLCSDLGVASAAAQC